MLKSLSAYHVFGLAQASVSVRSWHSGLQHIQLRVVECDEEYAAIFADEVWADDFALSRKDRDFAFAFNDSQSVGVLVVELTEVA